jgi:phosphate-selective porin OprO/OprP
MTTSAHRPCRLVRTSLTKLSAALAIATFSVVGARPTDGQDAPWYAGPPAWAEPAPVDSSAARVLTDHNGSTSSPIWYAASNSALQEPAPAQPPQPPSPSDVPVQDQEPGNPPTTDGAAPAIAAPAETIAPATDDEEAEEPEWVEVEQKWTLKYGGAVQADYINWAQTDIPGFFAQDYFEFRRLRFHTEGTGYGVYDFRFQLELEPENDFLDGVVGPDVSIKDMWLGMSELPGRSYVRFGNFFVPFSLEALTSSSNVMFMERSIPSAGVFSPDREVGAAWYTSSSDERMTLASGVFFDSINEGLKEKVDDNQGVRVGTRWTWTPFYDEPSGGRYMTHVGAGIVYTNDGDGLVRFRTRPSIHEGPRVIDTGIMAAESFTVMNLEWARVAGPLCIQSEWFTTMVDRTVADDVTLFGSYLQASYFLTGENRVYEPIGRHYGHFGRVKPHTNFWLVPGCRGIGAWEPKIRWSWLDFTDVDEGQYHDLTVGVNWYWTDRTRWMFEWIHPWTTAQTPFGTTSSNLLATRLDFTF